MNSIHQVHKRPLRGSRLVALLATLASGVLAGAGCNGSDGATGPAGDIGPAGDTGPTAAQGASGPAGSAGQDAAPCTVKDNGDGTFDIDCPDGTSATLTSGANGADGTGCTASGNGDGSYDISCGDTSVTVSSGSSPLVVTAEASEAECGTLGGVRVDVGVDTSGDGTLDPSEVTSSRPLCRSMRIDDLVDSQRLHDRLADLLTIAQDNPGVMGVPSRAGGSAGEAATFDYIESILAPNYRITKQPYDFVFFAMKSDAELEQIAPNAQVYTVAHEEDTNDFIQMRFSAPGEVTADVAPVDVVDATSSPPNTSTSGRELPAHRRGTPRAPS